METPSKVKDLNPEFIATYSVTGMTCGHCVASVTEEISELNTVTSVDVALNAEGASEVTVRSTESLADRDVVAAISEAGYEVATA